ncbi:MAG: dihydrofolate reductase family protein [Chloroflexi bacterium]|nr:dihydrofolate reductase family protein [Chloroflexota bacterium]
MAGGSVYELPPNEDGRLDLGILLDRLGDLEVDSLMVEGGARVITSFLKHALADLLFVTVAPRLVGGLHAVESLLSSAGETNLQVADFPQIFDMDSEKVGDDLVIWGWLHPEQA